MTKSSSCSNHLAAANDAALLQEEGLVETRPIQAPLSLKVNFTWTLMGNLIYGACQWGVLTVIAKFGTPEMVGQLALGLAIATPVIMFANLQLRGVQATDAEQLFCFNEYFALRIITTALAFISIFGIALIGGFRIETKAVVIIIGLAKSFEAISDVFYGLLQRHERMDRIAKRIMVKGLLGLLCVGGLLYLTKSIVYAVLGLLAANILSLLFYDFQSAFLVLDNSNCHWKLSRLLAVLRPRWDLRPLKKLAWLALPLGFVMMLISLNSNIPRYFLEHSLGEHGLGIFAAMAYIVVAGGMVVNALGQAIVPRLAKYYAKSQIDEYKKIIFKVLILGLAIGVFGIAVALIVGKPLLTILYKPEYAQRIDVFVLLMIAGGMQYLSSFLGYGMTAARRFRIQLPLFLTVTLVVSAASYLLIPVSGLRGAAVALLIGGIVQLFGSGAVVLHAIRSKSGLFTDGG